MRKIHPERYNGVEFIRLSNLPFDHMVHLKSWLSDLGIFTIQKQHGAIQNCVHYEDYEFWFDNYKSENQQAEYAIF